MTRLLMIRHAATQWNRSKRIQGVSDISIDKDARREATEWRIPNEFHDSIWVSSPLERAVETARILGTEPAREQRLIEMNWGEWEGETLEGLRHTLGDVMAENEDQGLDFRPPSGESPREVQGRLRPWLHEVASSGIDTIAVTHKGVIRAVMALATGWDMMGKAPDRILNGAGHLFLIDREGVPSVVRLNIPLVTDIGVP
jgi:broad specificity phosphatase PhoE